MHTAPYGGSVPLDPVVCDNFSLKQELRMGNLSVIGILKEEKTVALL
jgi:hypothetical protein